MSESTKVVVLDDYQGVAAEAADWHRAGIEVTSIRQHLATDELVAAIGEHRIVIAMRERTPFPATLIERLPNLELLVTTGMRNASIDLEAAAAAGIVVSGTASMASPSAELTWGLILALARRIPTEDANVRRGGWQTTVGIGLEGRTLGLLGLGRIGGRVAEVGRAFGMRTVAWSQNLTAERAAEVGAEAVSRSVLLRDSDIVSVHLQLSDRTRGLIGEQELAQMKPTAYLVNTSRSPIVDQEALERALRERRIAGAGLDVYDLEPLPETASIRDTPNTVLTPHIGYVTQDNYAGFYGGALEDIEAFLAGAPIRVLEPAGGSRTADPQDTSQ